MALINCPECGAQISDRAVSCIKCGYPLSGNKDISQSSSMSESKTADSSLSQNTTAVSSDENKKVKESMEYLQPIIKLESSVLEQGLIINKYKDICETCKPQYQERQLLSVPSDFSDGGISKLIVAFLAIGLFGFLIISSTGCPLYIPFIVAVVLGVIPAIVAAYISSSKKTKFNEKVNQILEKNKKIQEENTQNKQEYEKKMTQWQLLRDKNLEYMDKPLAETRETLEKLYSVNFIHSKYRNLPAVTSIYDYLSTGRCSTLTGPNGAYNLYEEELRKDTIISQLNTIIDSLEQIKRNQYTLYQEVHGILINTEKMTHQLEEIRYRTKEIAEYASITAYYSGITAANSSALLFYDSIKK